MHRRGWRRFRPLRGRFVESGEDIAEVPLFHRARLQLGVYLDEMHEQHGRKLHVHHLELAINEQRQRAENTGSAFEWLVLLVLQAPRAAHAQHQMDIHPHGHHNRHQHLYELIDFNDAFVSTVLALPDDHLSTFVDQLQKEINLFCRQLHAPSFTNVQYEAIVHGMSREIAVYRGAIKEGFTAQMTNRHEDALGIDLVIGDPQRDQHVNVDCKTASSYFLRLQDLVREGRLSSGEEARAERDGFVTVVNHDQGRQIRVVILRIDSELLGPITHFSFENTTKFGELLRHVFSRSHQ